jgi:hypothetical protein
MLASCTKTFGTQANSEEIATAAVAIQVMNHQLLAKQE